VGSIGATSAGSRAQCRNAASRHLCVIIVGPANPRASGDTGSGASGSRAGTRQWSPRLPVGNPGHPPGVFSRRRAPAPDLSAPGFFDRSDDRDDAVFYGPPRLVHHIDDAAIAGVGAFYDEIGVDGDVLDLMSSWVSHISTPPRHLTVLGMNTAELEANTRADTVLVHDLNTHPTLPFADATFDTVVCTVSVDYLTRPVEVFTDVARVLRPGARSR